MEMIPIRMEGRQGMVWSVSRMPPGDGYTIPSYTPSVVEPSLRRIEACGKMEI
jgi:hypothetical protein